MVRTGFVLFVGVIAAGVLVNEATVDAESAIGQVERGVPQDGFSVILVVVLFHGEDVQHVKHEEKEYHWLDGDYPGPVERPQRVF